MQTLVLGIGNTLMCDDGAGIHTMTRAQKVCADLQDVDFIDGGTLSFTLTGLINEADQLIVVDAAQLGAEPGTVRVFEDAAMDDFVVNGKCSSVHEVSLSELMDMVRLTDGLPGKRVLIGIQPESFDWSEQPTPQVDAGIDLAAEKVTSLLRSWHDV